MCVQVTPSIGRHLLVRAGTPATRCWPSALRNRCPTRLGGVRLLTMSAGPCDQKIGRIARGNISSHILRCWLCCVDKSLVPIIELHCQCIVSAFKLLNRYLHQAISEFLGTLCILFGFVLASCIALHANVGRGHAQTLATQAQQQVTLPTSLC